MRTLWAAVLLLLLGIQAGAGRHSKSSVPHVRSCNYCGKCILDGEAPAPFPMRGSPGGGGRPGSASPSSPTATGTSVPGLQISPVDEEAKKGLPNCTVCRGCNAELRYIKSETVSVTLTPGFPPLTFRHGTGATNSWIFFATPAGGGGVAHFGGSAAAATRYIVKVMCMPFSKVHGRPHKSCSVKTYAARLQLMMAQQQLAQECGAGDVYPRSWVAPIDAVVPAGGIGAGFHICWHVLWMEEAPGVTLMVLQQQPPLILPLLKKMNSTQLVAATVMELLTSQCDRHFQNIFIDGAGRLKLIDNDQALGTIPHCGANSELLPGSKYFNAVRLKYRHWYDKRAAEQQCGGHVDYRLLVDYRCHVPGRQLGTALPPPLRACMARIAALTTDEAIDAYGLPSRQNALALRTRARDMLTKGFEWTLQHGLPLNRGMYASADPQPPCCAVVPHPDMFGLNGGGGGGSGTFIGKCADGDCFVPHFRPPPNATAGDLSEYRLEDFPALQL